MSLSSFKKLSGKKQALWTLIVQGILLIILFATAPKASQVIGQTFEPGNHALDLWGGMMGGDGLAASPLWVQIFLNGLFASSLVGIFFMRKHVPARWAAGGLLAGVFNTFFVIPYLPIISLGGMYAMMHFILWTPGLYLLIKERAFLKKWTPYSIWAAIVVGIILFSYVFDIRDTSVYAPYIWKLNFG